MFCEKCGKELADDAKFCNGCGNATGIAPAAQPAPAVQSDPAQPAQSDAGQAGADAAAAAVNAAVANAAAGVSRMANKIATAPPKTIMLTMIITGGLALLTPFLPMFKIYNQSYHMTNMGKALKALTLTGKATFGSFMATAFLTILALGALALFGYAIYSLVKIKDSNRFRFFAAMFGSACCLLISDIASMIIAASTKSGLANLIGANIKINGMISVYIILALVSAVLGGMNAYKILNANKQ